MGIVELETLLARIERLEKQLAENSRDLDVLMFPAVRWLVWIRRLFR